MGTVVAYAVVHGDPPEVYIAEDVDVLSRVLALDVVAQTRAHELDSGTRGLLQDALLDERWGDAVSLWISATKTYVDVYPSEDVWTDARLDAVRASFEFRMSPLFDEN